MYSPNEIMANQFGITNYMGMFGVCVILLVDSHKRERIKGNSTRKRRSFSSQKFIPYVGGRIYCHSLMKHESPKQTTCGNYLEFNDVYFERREHWISKGLFYELRFYKRFPKFLLQQLLLARNKLLLPKQYC